MLGIFDSGFGGLSVAKALDEILPNLDYTYLGDNARAPYGDKDQEIIYQYTKQAVDYLFSQGISLIVLACNTASSEALRKLQQDYLPQFYPDKNILGVIRPVAEVASAMSQNKKIAVLGTNATILSEAYVRELKTQDPQLFVVQQACPLLVPLVEESQENSKAAELIVAHYLSQIASNDFDTLILGCTHYAFLQAKIDAFFQGQKKILDSAIIVASKLVDYLARHREYLDLSKSQNKQKIFLTTGSTGKFDQAATKFLGKQINSQHINLK